MTEDQETTGCEVCGNEIAHIIAGVALCERCTAEAVHQIAEEGAKAEAAGEPVIWVHGRPYRDPAHERPDPTESPFPWDHWDGAADQ